MPHYDRMGEIKGEIYMTVMVADLYDALIKAGAPEENARKAAQEVASYDSRLVRLEAKVTMLQWMVGINMAMTATMMFKMFGAG